MDEKKPIGAKHVSTSRVAVLLDVHRRTVSRWCAKEAIPATRPHDRAAYRVDRKWVDRQIDARVVVRAGVIRRPAR